MGDIAVVTLLLLGATGRLGRALFAAINSSYGKQISIVAPIRASYPSGIINDIPDIISAVRPCLIINAVGAFDYGATINNYMINTMLPKVIASCARLVGSLYMHISTNYVFASTDIEVPADLTPDICNPDDYCDSKQLTYSQLTYAQSKCLAEHIVSTTCPPGTYKIIRVQNLCKGTGKRPDLIERIIQQAPTIKYRDTVIKPSDVHDVAATITELISLDNNCITLASSDPVEHIVPEKYTTEKAFIQTVAKHYKLNRLPGFKLILDNSNTQRVVLKPTITIPEITL